MKDETITESTKHSYTWGELETGVRDWAYARNLLHQENAQGQMLKVMEEVGELSSAIAKQKHMGEVKDAIGDVLVTIIILANQLGVRPIDCLRLAYDEIKDRGGKTVNGVFIKND
jgi:NTP pyrophosphatase (non-canonical NTP hydrolase)